MASATATAVLGSALSHALGAIPDIEIDRRVIEGDAGEVLVAEASKADLVVVGSHGRTGLKAALLRSMSRHVVDHTRRLVVVVKASVDLGSRRVRGCSAARAPTSHRSWRQPRHSGFVPDELLPLVAVA